MDKFVSFLQSEKLQMKLGNNIKKLALPQATKDIVKEIKNLVYIDD